MRHGQSTHTYPSLQLTLNANRGVPLMAPQGEAQHYQGAPLEDYKVFGEKKRQVKKNWWFFSLCASFPHEHPQMRNPRELVHSLAPTTGLQPSFILKVCFPSPLVSLLLLLLLPCCSSVDRWPHSSSSLFPFFFFTCFHLLFSSSALSVHLWQFSSSL